MSRPRKHLLFRLIVLSLLAMAAAGCTRYGRPITQSAQPSSEPAVAFRDEHGRTYYRDAAGRIYFQDASGRKYYREETRQRIFTDDLGRRYIVLSDGTKYYLDEAGRTVYTETIPSTVYVDEYGNRIPVEGATRYYIDEAGRKIYIDYGPRYYYMDESGTKYYIDKSDRYYVVDESGRRIYPEGQVVREVIEPPVTIVRGTELYEENPKEPRMLYCNKQWNDCSAWCNNLPRNFNKDNCLKDCDRTQERCLRTP